MPPKTSKMNVWQKYISEVMEDGICSDAAVLSTGQQPLKVLACHPGGIFEKLKKAEIEQLLSPNREILLTKGVTLGGRRCTVIRDLLHLEGHMDLRTKPERDGDLAHAVTLVKVGESCSLLLLGTYGTQGGSLNYKAAQMARNIENPQ
ncbi:profilin-2-like [Discoglossus pictus]